MAPTPNRTFFGNFFAAFRIHASYPKASSAAISTSTQHSTSAQSLKRKRSSSLPRSRSTSPVPSPTAARPISTKPPHTTSSTAAAVAAHAFQAARSPPPAYRAPSASPPLSPGPAYTPPRSPPPRHTASGFQKERTPSQTRGGAQRSSMDSDSGVPGNPWAQNWYIGGRTTTGEERFYKLGMVKRYTSADRLSLDRLSL